MRRGPRFVHILTGTAIQGVLYRSIVAWYHTKRFPQIRKSMARIKYVLNERRIAAREAQNLLEAADQSSSRKSRKVPRQTRRVSQPGAVPSFAEQTPSPAIQSQPQL